MPRAPVSATDRRSLADYRTAYKAAMKLLREGRSFSGHERNVAFLNCAGGPFANLSSVSGFDFDDDGRALGVTDWDQDGDLDVWVANRTGPRLRLMTNQTIGPAAPPENSFIAFLLQGTVSNRDAIGARVTVRTTSDGSHLTNRRLAPLMQTVTAGDAYLSQSSKWLHFGLGPSDETLDVHVRWPNGRTEQFDRLTPGQRYQLVEGRGEAILIESPARDIALHPVAQPELTAPPMDRTFFSNRLPLPLLRYKSLDPEDEVERLIQPQGRPLLICLWASWCGPCLSELEGLARHADTLRRSGLEVLALSVDGLDSSQTSTPADAHTLLTRLRFPLLAGFATRQLLEKLLVTQGMLFNRQLGISVPTSLLVDRHGGIAAIYHGTLDLDTLEADLQQLEAHITARRDRAVPMAGRWLAPPRQLLLRAVARVFQDEGYEEDHARFLKLDTETLKQRRIQVSGDAERRQFDEQFAAANYNLGIALLSAGERSEAAEHFREALAVQPDHAEALVNLGAILAQDGQLEEALRTLQRAVALDSPPLAARVNLAAALIAAERWADAVTQYEAILEKQPDHALAHAQLGRAQLELGRQQAAAEHLRQAVKQNPNDFAASLSLAWLLATSPDESIRDGATAVALAEQLRAAIQSPNPIVWDVLAAAYAEQHDFQAAQIAMSKALLQLGQRNPTLQRAFENRKAAYQRTQPHRDNDGKYP